VFHSAFFFAGGCSTTKAREGAASIKPMNDLPWRPPRLIQLTDSFYREGKEGREGFHSLGWPGTLQTERLSYGLGTSESGL
jgi:hypothetical protein